MEEEKNTVDFENDGWYDDENSVTEEDAQPETEESADLAAEAPAPEEANQQNPEEEAPEAEKPEESGELLPEPEAETDQFKLKVLGEELTVSREEVIALAQKGKDYDRIKDKLSELTAEKAKTDESMGFLRELAETQHMTVDELVDHTRAQVLAQREGIDMSIARGRVKNDRRERALAHKENRLKEQETQKEAQNQEAIKRQEGIKAFLAKYKNVDPNTIPQEVWRDVSAGESLLSAYTRYENGLFKREIEALNAKLKAQEQDRKNRERSAGSRQTEGKSRVRDEWDVSWYDDD